MPRSPQPASNTHSLIDSFRPSSLCTALLAFAHESVVQPFHRRPDRRRQDLDRTTPCRALWPAVRRSRPGDRAPLRRAGEHGVRDRGRSRLPPAREPAARRMQPAHTACCWPPAPAPCSTRSTAASCPNAAIVIWLQASIAQQLERLARDHPAPAARRARPLAAAAAPCARYARTALPRHGRPRHARRTRAASPAPPSAASR